MMSNIKAPGCIPDSKTWTSLIFGQCVAGDVKKAFNFVRAMVKNFGITDAGLAFEEVVNGFFQQRKTIEAYKFLFKMVGRHSEAHDCFSKCPSYVRNRADVSKLFVAHEPESVNATAVTA
ncbi:hypothetical protein IFM89_001422 [Coptis chinensis]|uniref:Pentatricopeptide repeat-containing protein n=1 Tax=Coptis chinensis TaxID=261450 RepID=A0A835H3U6_9MAGN|nr:hypothetical protein IFM89_001422 [Coptis chinensis]